MKVLLERGCVGSKDYCRISCLMGVRQRPGEQRSQVIDFCSCGMKTTNIVYKDILLKAP